MKRTVMMNITGFLIHMLGGITKEEFSSFKDKCSEFAQENLQGKNGEVSPDACFYLPFDNDNIIVLKSKISILGGRVKKVVFAPWCQNTSMEGVHIIGDKS